MLSLDTFIVFFGINLSLCLMPTPEMVMVVSNSSTQSKLAGIAVVLGICTGLVLQVVMLAFGLTAIIQTSETVFTVLKVVGVGYLLYLAFQAFKQPVVVCDNGETSNLMTLYRHGFMLNVSNPTNPLFLLVFFPPFLEADGGPVVSQLLQLGGIMIVAAFLMFTLMSILSEVVGKAWLNSEKIRKYLNIGSGTTIAGFAVYLSLARQSLN